MRKRQVLRSKIVAGLLLIIFTSGEACAGFPHYRLRREANLVPFQATTVTADFDRRQSTEADQRLTRLAQELNPISSDLAAQANALAKQVHALNPQTVRKRLSRLTFKLRQWLQQEKARLSFQAPTKMVHLTLPGLAGVLLAMAGILTYEQAGALQMFGIFDRIIQWLSRLALPDLDELEFEASLGIEQLIQNIQNISDLDPQAKMMLFLEMLAAPPGRPVRKQDAFFFSARSFGCQLAQYLLIKESLMVRDRELILKAADMFQLEAGGIISLPEKIMRPFDGQIPEAAVAGLGIILNEEDSQNRDYRFSGEFSTLFQWANDLMKRKRRDTPAEEQRKTWLTNIGDLRSMQAAQRRNLLNGCDDLIITGNFPETPNMDKAVADLSKQVQKFLKREIFSDPFVIVCGNWTSSAQTGAQMIVGSSVGLHFEKFREESAGTDGGQKSTRLTAQGATGGLLSQDFNALRKTEAPAELLANHGLPGQYDASRLLDEKIVLMQFQNANDQDDVWARMAWYFEINRGQILAAKPDHHLVGDGYNFQIKQIVTFFNDLRRKNLPLFSAEESFLQDLLSGGWISDNGNNYEPNQLTKDIVFLSFWNNQDHWRGKTLWHEIHHGAYMTDHNYREAINRWWQHLPEEQQSYLISVYLPLVRNDMLLDRDFVIREVAAYLWANGAMLDEKRKAAPELLVHIAAVWDLNAKSTLFHALEARGHLPEAMWEFDYSLPNGETATSFYRSGQLTKVMFLSQSKEEVFSLERSWEMDDGIRMIKSETDSGFAVECAFVLDSDQLNWHRLSIKERRGQGHAVRIAKWLAGEARRRYPQEQFPLLMNVIINTAMLGIANKVFTPGTIQIQAFDQQEPFTALTESDLYELAKNVSVISHSAPYRLVITKNNKGDYVVLNAPDDLMIRFVDGWLIEVQGFDAAGQPDGIRQQGDFRPWISLRGQLRPLEELPASAEKGNPARLGSGERSSISAHDIPEQFDHAVREWMRKILYWRDENKIQQELLELWKELASVPGLEILDVKDLANTVSLFFNVTLNGKPYALKLRAPTPGQDNKVEKYRLLEAMVRYERNQDRSRLPDIAGFGITNNLYFWIQDWKPGQIAADLLKERPLSPSEILEVLHLIDQEDKRLRQIDLTLTDTHAANVLFEGDSPFAIIDLDDASLHSLERVTAQDTELGVNLWDEGYFQYFLEPDGFTAIQLHSKEKNEIPGMIAKRYGLNPDERQGNLETRALFTLIRNSLNESSFGMFTDRLEVRARFIEIAKALDRAVKESEKIAAEKRKQGVQNTSGSPRQEEYEIIRDVFSRRFIGPDMPDYAERLAKTLWSEIRNIEGLEIVGPISVDRPKSIYFQVRFQGEPYAIKVREKFFPGEEEYYTELMRRYQAITAEEAEAHRVPHVAAWGELEQFNRYWWLVDWKEGVTVWDAVVLRAPDPAVALSWLQGIQKIQAFLETKGLAWNDCHKINALVQPDGQIAMIDMDDFAIERRETFMGQFTGEELTMKEHSFFEFLFSGEMYEAYKEVSDENVITQVLLEEQDILEEKVADNELVKQLREKVKYVATNMSNNMNAEEVKDPAFPGYRNEVEILRDFIEIAALLDQTVKVARNKQNPGSAGPLLEGALMLQILIGLSAYSVSLPSWLGIPFMAGLFVLAGYVWKAMGAAVPTRVMDDGRLGWRNKRPDTNMVLSSSERTPYLVEALKEILEEFVKRDREDPTSHDPADFAAEAPLIILHDKAA